MTQWLAKFVGVEHNGAEGFSMRFLIKVLITALVVVGVSELGKRFSWVAAILASLPLTSILAMIWLYWDTGDAKLVSDLSVGILWAVLPSLFFFALLPILLKSGLRFSVAMPLACAGMAAAYAVYGLALKTFGIKL
jgi:hypothetical protein